jgi:hypothetical protein
MALTLTHTIRMTKGRLRNIPVEILPEEMINQLQSFTTVTQACTGMRRCRDDSIVTEPSRQFAGEDGNTKLALCVESVSPRRCDTRHRTSKGCIVECCELGCG